MIYPDEVPALSKVPEYADMIPIDEWLGAVKAGAFLDYDGFGDLATNNGVSAYRIHPSMVKGKVKIPLWVTHIAWYNR